MDESFVNSHMRFVRALLTSRSEFVQMTLEKIVKGFRFRKLATSNSTSSILCEVCLSDLNMLSSPLPCTQNKVSLLQQNQPIQIL